MEMRVSVGADRPGPRATRQAHREAAAHSRCEVVLGVQQHPEGAHGAERVRMPITDGLAPHLQRVAYERLSGAEVALIHQKQAQEAVHGVERVWVPITQRLVRHLERLAQQRLSIGKVALVHITEAGPVRLRR